MSRNNLEYFYHIKDVMSKVLGKDVHCELKNQSDCSVWKKHAQKMISVIEVSIDSSYSNKDVSWDSSVSAVLREARESIETSTSMESVLSAMGGGVL